MLVVERKVVMSIATILVLFGVVCAFSFGIETEGNIIGSPTESIIVPSFGNGLLDVLALAIGIVFAEVHGLDMAFRNLVYIVGLDKGLAVIFVNAERERIFLLKRIRISFNVERKVFQLLMVVIGHSEKVFIDDLNVFPKPTFFEIGNGFAQAVTPLLLLIDDLFWKDFEVSEEEVLAEAKPKAAFSLKEDEYIIRIRIFARNPIDGSLLEMDIVDFCFGIIDFANLKICVHVLPPYLHLQLYAHDKECQHLVKGISKGNLCVWRRLVVIL